MSTPREDVSILLVDDHQLVVDGIKSMLASVHGFQVAGEANDGQTALEMIQANPGKYQLLIADINMPLMGGTELCKAVKCSYPDIKVLILSMYNNVSVVKEAIAAEADGYMLKNTGRDELLTALSRVMDSGTYFSQDIIPIICSQYVAERDADRQLSVFTPREKEILSLIVKEMTSGEIAEMLCISKKTVDTHRANILEKSSAKSTIGLVTFAIRTGLVEV